MVGDLVLSHPQHIFLNKLDTKFRAYVGGFGSGKTYVGCLDLLIFAMQNHNVSQGYFGPTYSSIKDIFWPTIEEAAFSMGLTVIIKRSDKEVFIYQGAFPIGHIICRSMDRPESIVGFKIARALVDEIDTMPIDKATAAWRKIIARMRLTVKGVLNSVGVTCTPEGFLFVYNQFKKKPTKSYSMVQSSTYENARYLPTDYIDSLVESYPSQLVEAYLNGEFVNLTANSVYYPFDRTIHDTHYVIKPREPLLIGMDFNVNDMCATIHIKRKGLLYAVGELFGLRDTPDMCDTISERYSDHHITIYPDASGRGTTSKSASLSDIKILKVAGFQIKAKKKNPFIKDRVNAFNAALEHGRYFVNTRECPDYTEALEQQVYDPKTGQPKKDGILDNRVDGAGYLVTYDMPIIRQSARQQQLGGF